MPDVRLTLLKQLAKGLAAQFGSDCEVVIHDLSKHSVENSIVCIENGHVTGRMIGGSSSETVLNAISHPEEPMQDHLAYLTKTESGRILKSSTIYINDDNNTPRYILSINYDITNLLGLENSLHALTSAPEEKAGHAENGEAPRIIPHDVNELLDELIEQADQMVGVPVALMTREDKIKGISYLNEAGAFLITKSGDKIARHYSISKYTLYSYVDINK